MAYVANPSWKSELIWAFRSRRVVTAEGVRPATLLVKDGRILEVADWDGVPTSAHLRDYGDYVLLPGLVDTHVHINDAGPHENSRTNWEGFATATQAAAAGGVTTLVDMPVHCVPETLSVESLEAKRAAAVDQAWVDWMTWGGAVGNAGIGGNESDLQLLAEAGVPGFKCFLMDAGIDGFAWVDEAQLRKTLAILRGLKPTQLPLLAHAEVDAPIKSVIGKLENADWRKYSNYLKSRPEESELDAIQLLIGLAIVFATPLHIVHLSSAAALPVLKKARDAGLKITVETCPHYLWFAAEEIPDGATEFKCAPPIRSAANREALWDGLRDGIIDMITTDHSPCPLALKGREEGRFDRAWGGIASLGLSLPIIWTGLQAHGGGLEQLIRWLSTEPSRLAGLTGLKGALAPGYDADIVVFDPDTQWVVTEEELRFRHRLSPYLGARLQGRVLETYLRGECIFWDRGEGGVMDPVPQGLELRRTL